jgi:hypothetical protein
MLHTFSEDRWETAELPELTTPKHKLNDFMRL